MAAFTSTALQYSSTSYLQSLAPSLEGTRDHNSRCVRVRSYKPTGQRLHPQNVARGITIQSAATKPAKSPGTCSELTLNCIVVALWRCDRILKISPFFTFLLDVLAEEDWKVKREYLQQKRVSVSTSLCHAYLLNAQISTLASVVFNVKVSTEISR